MALTLIATPIGHKDDITLRALNHLKEAKIIIGEEAKVLRRRLSEWSIPPREKEIYELNEHSSTEDVDELFNLCSNNEVALVTDCGTPSFFDPGFKLVKICHENHIAVNSLPGVSSMTALFPYLKHKTESFEVLGFPPRDNEERKEFFKKLKNEKNKKAYLLLDTPYRLIKTFEDLSLHLPKAECTVGINLTCEDELIVYGNPKEILKQISHLKKENFICMVDLRF
jgi:16S rRNA (cytidine1402-2'-O)-methyltransferase